MKRSIKFLMVICLLLSFSNYSLLAEEDSIDFKIPEKSSYRMSDKELVQKEFVEKDDDSDVISKRFSFDSTNVSSEESEEIKELIEEHKKIIDEQENQKDKQVGILLSYDSYIKGDVIQILEPHLWYERAYHTMMITGYNRNTKTFKVTYHSSERLDVDLTSFVLANWNLTSRTKLRFYHIPENFTW